MLFKLQKQLVHIGGELAARELEGSHRGLDCLLCGQELQWMSSAQTSLFLCENSHPDIKNHFDLWQQ